MKILTLSDMHNKTNKLWEMPFSKYTFEKKIISSKIHPFLKLLHLKHLVVQRCEKNKKSLAFIVIIRGIVIIGRVLHHIGKCSCWWEVEQCLLQCFRHHIGEECSKYGTKWNFQCSYNFHWIYNVTRNMFGSRSSFHWNT